MLRNDSGGCARAVWYERFQRWTKSVAPWWMASIAAHLAIFIVLALVLGTVHVATRIFDVVEIETVLNPPHEDVKFQPLDWDAPLVEEEHSKTLDVLPQETLDATVDQQPIEPPTVTSTQQVATKADFLPGEIGNLFKGQARELGPGGQSVRLAVDVKGWQGGPGASFAGRGDLATGRVTPGTGETSQTKRAVWKALEWIDRHQARDGRWSLEYSALCADGTCTGGGRINSDTAATAFGLLPLLAAGQTHQDRSLYAKTVLGGLSWLIQRQAGDGNLAAGNSQPMYAHGLATICLCEAFGMTKDRRVGAAAQQAIKFIETAQNTDDGGWRYKPGDPGDTSVFGWQLMALKSAEMAGLDVSPSANALTKKYLKSASRGQHGGLYGYMPGQPGSPAMTAVGMLCSQYSGAKRSDPAMIEGMNFLLSSLPAKQRRDCYFWYYATQAMHNMTGAEWDTWNRAMRRVLVETQVKEGCAAGSWDPAKPVQDQWGEQGGRLMVTSLAALTLEVYYRYLPLYKLDKVEE